MNKVDKDKRLGQYFTPDFVTDFMINLSSKDYSDAVLEPCAGDGVFLRSISNKGFKNVIAYEIDSTLNIDSPFKIFFKDFLRQRISNKFDLVIGNPPYVRWKHIPEDVKGYLINDPFWKERINSLTDLLYPFIFASVDALKINGALIFITPIFWTKTLHSSPLRRYLSNIGELEVLINFNEMKIFEKVSSSIIIFKFVKKKSGQPIRVININSKNRLEPSHLAIVNKLLKRLESGEEYISDGDYEAFLHPQFVNSQPWNAIPSIHKPLINKIEASCTKFSPKVEANIGRKTISIPLSQLFLKDDLEELGIPIKRRRKARFAGTSYYITDQNQKSLGKSLKGKSLSRYVRLGDVAEIANGLVSGLDAAFCAKNINQFSEEEKEKLIKIVKAYDLKQYYSSGYTPYIFVNAVKNEDDLLRLYPNIYSKLQVFRKGLEERYQYNRTIPWWHWVFLRNWELLTTHQEKIFTPCKERIDKKEYARFSHIKGYFLPTQDVTAIVKKDIFKENIKYLLAILNSDMILTWMKYKGLARGGVLEFSEKPLSRIPIRLIDWDNPKDVGLHDSIVNLVDTILKEKQILPYRGEIEKILYQLYEINSIA